MALRTARKLAVLMVREFQPYGATWAQLKRKSGMKPTTYKRAFNWATERKWFVGGGEQGAPYYLNPDGCWRAALDSAVGPENRSTGVVERSCDAETGTNGPSGPSLDPKAKNHLALINEAIWHVDQDQKKRSSG
jgi:hypothetical protein